MLLQEAGHADFRDARGPMGFTQRQANGTFTRDGADAFIERLTREADEALDPGGAPVSDGGSGTTGADPLGPVRVDQVR